MGSERPSGISEAHSHWRAGTGQEEGEAPNPQSPEPPSASGRMIPIVPWVFSPPRDTLDKSVASSRSTGAPPCRTMMGHTRQPEYGLETKDA
jgi:hypothetical protein